MASTRPVSGDGGDGVDLLGSAAAVRWSRPDLTGSIADHVLEIADADADDALWLRAAGWAVYARSATGDGRGVASAVLDGVARRGSHVLDEPAADRLRVELAVLATGADRLATARTLLTPVAVADTAPELRADALCALSRCALEDRPTAVDALLRRVDATWAEVGGRRGHVGAAAASLVAAAAERRAGRPAAAVDRAAAGLASLESARGSRAVSPSRHLAAGLAAEWLCGLLDAGRIAEAREGCAPMEPRLRDTDRPSRQIALLRLTVARIVAGTGAEAVEQAVAQAARDALASDAPDLEAVCASALGALQKKSGQLGESIEPIRRGEAARRRDEERARRFRAALDTLVPVDPGDRVRREPDHMQEPLAGNEVGGRSGSRHRTDTPADSGVWTDWSSAVARDRTVPPPVPVDSTEYGPTPRTADGRGPARGGAAAHRSASSGAPRHSADRSDHEAADRGAPNGVPGPPPVYDELEASTSAGAAPEGASPWRGWTEDSPIGRLLARSLHADDVGEPSVPTRPDGTRPPRRYPDAVTDPWSTGSWSTGHWAAADAPSGSGSNGSAGGDRPADVPRAGRGGRRRRADPDGEFTTTAAPDLSGVEPVERRGTGSSVSARGRGSQSDDRDDRSGAADTVSEGGRDVAGAGHDAVAERRDGRPAGVTGWAGGGWTTPERVVSEPAGERRTPGGGVADDRPAADREAAERRAAERAVVERAVVEQAVAEQPVAERAVVEQPVVEQPVVEQPVVEQPVVEQGAVDQGAAERAAAGRAAADQIAAERVAAERRAAEPVASEPVATGLVAAERSAAERSDAGRTHAERSDAEHEWAEREWAEHMGAGQDAAEPAAGSRAAERVAAVERDADLAVEPGSGSWLQNALAELDRALAASVPVESRPEAPAPEAEGCVVVVDLARDGRRFAGRRAGGVVRALGERLAERLPAGARLRHDESDALSVVLPGWTRSPATEWMHRTLPGLFENFVTDEDMPGTQLRAAVHDTDGPAGAQLLQRLDGPGRTGGGRRHRRAAAEDAAGNGPAADRTDPAADTDGLGLADLLAGALAAYRGI